MEIILSLSLFFYRTSMMEGSGSLEQQLEATKVCLIEKNIIIVIIII